MIAVILTDRSRPMRVLGMFVKQPAPGAVKTRLAHDIGEEAAAAFYRACLDDLAGRFATSGDRRWLGYAPDTAATREWFQAFAAGRYELWPQPADDLGRRIEAFFTAALDSASSRAVLIGSDSPHLPREVVETAFAALAEVDVVLGPAADGGYYLIGARRSPHGWLEGVRWSSPWTLADTVLAARRQDLTLSLLPLGSDVDTAADLGASWGMFSGQRLADPACPISRTEAWLADWVATSLSGRRDP
jgi:uncharacterized protein